MRLPSQQILRIRAAWPGRERRIDAGKQVLEGDTLASLGQQVLQEGARRAAGGLAAGVRYLRSSRMVSASRRMEKRFRKVLPSRIAGISACSTTASTLKTSTSPTRTERSVTP